MAMKGPEDWDYAEIRKSMLKLGAPSFKSGSAPPGYHCAHCPVNEGERCKLNCRDEYERIYGIEPV